MTLSSRNESNSDKIYCLSVNLYSFGINEFDIKFKTTSSYVDSYDEIDSLITMISVCRALNE